MEKRKIIQDFKLKAKVTGRGKIKKGGKKSWFEKERKG